MSGTCCPAPVYSVVKPEPLSLSQNGLVGNAVKPHELIKCCWSVEGVVPGLFEARSVRTYCAKLAGASDAIIANAAPNTARITFAFISASPHPKISLLDHRGFLPLHPFLNTPLRCSQLAPIWRAATDLDCYRTLEIPSRSFSQTQRPISRICSFAFDSNADQLPADPVSRSAGRYLTEEHLPFQFMRL